MDGPHRKLCHQPQGLLLSVTFSLVFSGNPPFSPDDVAALTTFLGLNYCKGFLQLPSQLNFKTFSRPVPWQPDASLFHSQKWYIYSAYAVSEECGMTWNYMPCILNVLGLVPELLVLWDFCLPFWTKPREESRHFCLLFWLLAAFSDAFSPFPTCQLVAW